MTILALLVGIDDYEKAGDLRGCVRDSNLVREFLDAQYPNEPRNIVQLPQKEATKKRITRELGLLARAIGKDDGGVFYFAGHGSTIPSVGNGARETLSEMICPVEFDRDNRVETGISDKEIRSILQELNPSSRLYLLFESCWAGGLSSIADMMTARDGLLPRTVQMPPDVVDHNLRIRSRLGGRAYGFARANGLQNVVFWTACAAEEVASPYHFKEGLGGEFTHFLLQALRTRAGTIRPLWDLHSKLLIDLELHFSRQHPQLVGSLVNLAGPFLATEVSRPSARSTIRFYTGRAGSLARRVAGSVTPRLLQLVP